MRMWNLTRFACLLPLACLMTLFLARAPSSAATDTKPDSNSEGRSEPVAGEPQNANEQLRLGKMYYHGSPQKPKEPIDEFFTPDEMGAKRRGVSQDFKKAFEWYTKAALQGNADAQLGLGMMYDRGEGVLKDDKKAIEWCMKAALQGSTAAQYYLGTMYERGIGSEQDFEKAMEWYTKAALQGNVDAQFHMFLLYALGMGVPQDDKKAYAWASIAASDGAVKNVYIRNKLETILTAEAIVEAQALASELFETIQKQKDAVGGQKYVGWLAYVPGWGYLGALGDVSGLPYVNESLDEKRTCDLLYKSDELQENAEEQFRLGQMYDGGRGRPLYNRKAIELYTKAALQGNKAAQFRLGVMYDEGEGVPPDFKKAFMWYTKAAQQGNAEEQFRLGVMYDMGRGVSQDFDKAAELYTKAALQGHTDAQLFLGVMCKRGEGVPQDDKKAYAWASISAATGERRNVDVRDRLAKNMTAKAVIEAQALASELFETIQKQMAAVGGLSDAKQDEDESEEWRKKTDCVRWLSEANQALASGLFETIRKQKVYVGGSMETDMSGTVDGSTVINGLSEDDKAWGSALIEAIRKRKASANREPDAK